MEEIIGIIVTFLLGLTALGHFWREVHKVLKAVKEVLDVPASVAHVSKLVDEGLEDKTLTTVEVQAITEAVKDVKQQFDEAKDALAGLRVFKMKVLRG